MTDTSEFQERPAYFRHEPDVQRIAFGPSAPGQIDSLVPVPPRREPVPFRPGGRPVLGSNGPSFSIDAFAREVRDRLSGSVGWAFAVARNGQFDAERSDADGRARRSGDAPERPMTFDTRVNIASVSKTITAVAALRLLDDLGLTVEDPVLPFLPPDWSVGPGITDLRFVHLLTHSSGIVSVNTNFANTLSYDALRNAVLFGANPGTPGVDFDYKNVNFALFRVLIPNLWTATGRAAIPAINAEAAALGYAVQIIEEVFGVIGGFGEEASTSLLENDPALYYSIGNTSPGVSLGNWAGIAGGGGWHLTARELAAFAVALSENDTLLAPALRAQMDTRLLGLQAVPGAFGTYLGHGGSIGQGSGQVRTAIMRFPIRLDAALVVNSDIPANPDDTSPGNGYQATELLRDAYDAAWV